MGYTSTPVRQDTTLTLSHDGRATQTTDLLYLELPLKNGTSIFVPIGETCVPTD